MAFYKSKYTGTEIDQRLAQATYDDAVLAGFEGTKEEFDAILGKLKEIADKAENSTQMESENLETFNKNIVDAINELHRELQAKPDEQDVIDQGELQVFKDEIAAKYATRDEFNDDIENLNSKISTLNTNLVESVNTINKNVNDSLTIVNQAIQQNAETLIAEIEQRKEADKEIKNALNNDPNFAATITNELSKKLDSDKLLSGAGINVREEDGKKIVDISEKTLTKIQYSDSEVRRLEKDKVSYAYDEKTKSNINVILPEGGSYLGNYGDDNATIAKAAVYDGIKQLELGSSKVHTNINTDVNITIETSEGKKTVMAKEDQLPGVVTDVFGQIIYNPYNVQVAYNKAILHGDEYEEEPAERHNFVIDGVTTENAGVMAAADKVKLDSIDLSKYATAESLESYALKTELPDTSKFITEEDLPKQYILEEGAAYQIGDEQHEVNIKTSGRVTINSANELVKYTPYPGEEGRKMLVLANNDSITGMKVDGTGSPLIFMSKWDKVEVGGSGVALNLNSTDGQITINDDKVIATTEALDTKADKTELENVVKYTDISDADDTPRKTIMLDNNDTLSAYNTTGTANNIAMISKWDVVDLGSTGLPINLNGSKERPTYNDNEELALVSDMSEYQPITDNSLATSAKTIPAAINEIKESVDSISDPYEINLTNLLSAEDSESISTAIGGIDNLRATVQDNRIIVGTISNGSVSVSIRILGNVTTLYYLLDSVVGLTLNEIAITNTSGTLSKSITTHSVLTENMVINSLTSDETTLPLSAAQGKVLDSKINSINVSVDITNAINALDSAGQTASAGEVISSVSQENGIISVSKKTLTSDDIPELPQSKITDLEATLAGKQDSGDYATNSALTDGLATKQDTLTPGTGIEITPENQINVTLDTTVFKVVSVLPDSPAQGDENKIHLVPAESTGANNAYTEYIWVNSAWEILGEYTSEVDLTTYLTIEKASETYATKTELQEVQNSVNGKQDTLISGQNIKSIDGESLLGEGDIQIKYPVPGYPGSPHYPDGLCILLTSEGSLDFGETPETLLQKLRKGVTWIKYGEDYYLIRSISWSNHYYWISAVNMWNINETLDISVGSGDPIVEWNDTKEFQLTEDNTLQTTSKTVPGAINELKLSIDDHTSKLPVYTVVPTLTGNYRIPVNNTTQEKVYQIAIGSTVYGVYGEPGIIWQNGIDPVVEANCTIIVSVINNLAVWGKFKNE